MSAKYNLTCKQGTTFILRFVIKNDSTPWNITSYSATMTVRPFAGASTTTVVASTANGMITFEPTYGRVIVNIPSSITSGFSVSRHEYDLILNSGSVVTGVLEGKFVVTPGMSV